MTYEFHDAPSPRPSRAEARKQRKAEKAAAQPGSSPLVAKTKNQDLLLRHLLAGRHVFATGAAGTGKTYIPSRLAARALVQGTIGRIIVCRPAVSKSKHALGFRPGGTEQKMQEWLVPIVEAIRKEVSGATLDKWKQNGQFEVVPFETMRGRTFDDAFVILDEAQNCDYQDLRMFLTRAGENGQIVVSGDTDQIDVPGSGLAEVIDMILEEDIPVEVVQFTEEDCVRSPLARAFVIAFKKREERKKAEAERRRAIAEGRVANDPEPTRMDVPPPFLMRPTQLPEVAA